MHPGGRLYGSCLMMKDEEELMPEIKPIDLSDTFTNVELTYSKMSAYAELTHEFRDKLLEEVTMDCMIHDDTIDSLVKGIWTDVQVGIDTANGVDITTFTNFKITREIKNIRRVKKGKRYVIKFDYTGLCTYVGEMTYGKTS